MAAALDRNEELRRRMVSDVAHELRAPLTNIRCELESMQDGLTTPTPERIASLHDETMHLARSSTICRISRSPKREGWRSMRSRSPWRARATRRRGHGDAARDAA